VLGFDQALEPGSIGSGTVGYGRIWRYLHSELRYANMQAEAVEIFRELEKKTGLEMLHSGGLLYMKPVGHPDIQEFMKYGEKLSSSEINRRWPALTIPDYIEGVFTVEAGVANVKNALKGCRQESTRLGADLRYGYSVKDIDHATSTVTLADGSKYSAKNIVVTCGATTD
jgi:glycine/D-amino acid oxidase-like deaminating enzyme